MSATVTNLHQGRKLLPYEAERHDLMAQQALITARLNEIDEQPWCADYQRRQAAMHITRRDEIVAHHQRMQAKQQPAGNPAGTFEFPHGGDAA